MPEGEEERGGNGRGCSPGGEHGWALLLRLYLFPSGRNLRGGLREGFGRIFICFLYALSKPLSVSGRGSSVIAAGSGVAHPLLPLSWVWRPRCSL